MALCKNDKCGMYGASDLDGFCSMHDPHASLVPKKGDSIQIVKGPHKDKEGKVDSFRGRRFVLIETVDLEIVEASIFDIVIAEGTVAARIYEAVREAFWDRLRKRRAQVVEKALGEYKDRLNSIDDTLRSLDFEATSEPSEVGHDFQAHVSSLKTIHSSVSLMFTEFITIPTDDLFSVFEGEKLRPRSRGVHQYNEAVSFFLFREFSPLCHLRACSHLTQS